MLLLFLSFRQSSKNFEQRAGVYPGLPSARRLLLRHQRLPEVPLNVPAPEQSWFSLLWRRLRMMLIAVIVPELMVGFVARQFFLARALHKVGGDKFDVSITHGFFLSMGGFVSQLGHPIATIKQLQDKRLGPGYLSAIRKVDVADIMDKSKGDPLSRCLPVTDLEIATLAAAAVNICTWAIPVGPVEEFEAEIHPATLHVHWKRDPIDVLVCVATIPTYIIARLFLIVLPFTTLCSLPPGAFTDVDWTVYIPHIQDCLAGT
ncbi:hypothetical protein DFH09DRAFT_1338529 [Mycena vulgaris]|nr:hypothetical protein DFH09DRAFT_1338529 [Mycena vulgaris]